MSKVESKINSGAIFKNENKTSPAQPEYKGKINVEGVEFEIALWVNESKAKVKYFSVKIQTPFVKEEVPVAKVTSDLPF